MDGVEQYHGEIMPEEKLSYRWDIFAPVVKDYLVMDAGCAEGWWTHRALEAGAAQVISIDPLRKDVGLLVPDSKGKVLFFPQRIEDVPDVWAGMLDVIFCLRVLYHTQHPTLALERFVKWLKPGGVLYLETSAKLSGYGDFWGVVPFFDEGEKWRFEFDQNVVKRILLCLKMEVRRLGEYDGRILWQATKEAKA